MKKLLFVVATLLFATSCELIGRIEDWLSPSPAEQELYISLEQEGEPSRVQLDNVGKTVWTAEDKVSVFYNNSGNSCWCYAGETGESSGVFYNQLYVEDGETLKDIVLLYPYAESNSLSVADQCVYATIPALQHYEKDSYSIGANPMIASGDGDSFELKNVCVRLKLNVTGEKKVVKMTLTGDKGEQMAGRVAINYRDYTLSLIDEGSLSEEECAKQVTLDMGDEGVQLSKTPTAFYFVLAQSELPSAMTLVATYDDGTTRTTKIQKRSGLDIKRPVIGGVIPGVGGDDNGDNGDNGDDNQGGDDKTGGVEGTADSKTIYYTTTDGNIIEPKYYNFGANIISNTYENGIGKISFDGHVTTISKNAFSGIKTLETITLPIALTSIGDNAFASCDALTTVSMPNSVTELGYGIFDSCISLTNVSLGNRIPAITRSMFYDCFKLTKIVIPDSVEKIDDFAFCECYRLADVKFGSNVESIGSWVFDQNIRLENITLPHKLVSLGDGVFVGCKALQSVTMGEYVNSVGIRAFHGCEKLKEFNTHLATADKRGLIIDGELKGFAPADITEFAIPDNVTAIGAYVFYECKQLTGVTIPSSVGTIGDLAFCMTGLKSVFVPHSVATIGSSAFANCNSLTSVTLANGVATICEKAFYGCSKLTEISFPLSVDSIQSSAFGSCSALKSVYCHSKIPPVAGNNILNNNAADRKIYVHPTAVDAYQTANGWSKYASSIEGKVF